MIIVDTIWPIIGYIENIFLGNSPERTLDIFVYSTYVIQKGYSKKSPMVDIMTVSQQSRILVG